jgi:hypothetical protein
MSWQRTRHDRDDMSEPPDNYISTGALPSPDIVQRLVDSTSRS